MNENKNIHILYETAMANYMAEHKLCPKCGSTKHRSTCVFYRIDLDNVEEYQDINRCTCTDCGDIHTTHDRVTYKF